MSPDDDPVPFPDRWLDLPAPGEQRTIEVDWEPDESDPWVLYGPDGEIVSQVWAPVGFIRWLYEKE